MSHRYAPTPRPQTDSVMVIFNVGEGRRHDLRAHFELAGRVAAQISATFKAPNELEHEKCYYPYLLFSKKRYSGAHFFSGPHVISMAATVVTYVLGAYLLLVLLDAVLGFRLFRGVVRAGAGLYCRLTRKPAWERERCADRVFYSRWLWLAISLLMGSLTFRVVADLTQA